MTPEMIAILAVGVALAGLLLNNNHQVGKLRDRMAGIETRMAVVETMLRMIAPFPADHADKANTT